MKCVCDAGRGRTYDKRSMRQDEVLERPRRRAGECFEEVEHGPIAVSAYLYTAVLTPFPPTMRLCNCIPLSLLALTLSTTAFQVSWHPQPSAQSDTLVEVLNKDDDYTLLLSLLQRARLIPTLNKLNGSTFFAPTNDAVKRHADKSTLWQALLSETHSPDVPDNVQEQLRQQLFYHLLNYTLTELPADESTQTLQTLHYPQLPTDSSPRKPPSSPWFPIPHGLLGNHSQRLRLASRDGSTWVGVNASGKGGAELVKKGVEATNGIVYGVAEVLEPPPDLSE